jgi:ABC-type antimicrobial peptide transport system permease subunit
MYGVLAYSIAQRTREIGLRIAVGATKGDVVGLVIHQAAWPTVLGLIAGGGTAFAVARVLQSLLFGTSRIDAGSVAITVGGVLLISAIATVLPARRAAMVNPTEALRAE